MDHYRLLRTGDVDLVFEGRRIGRGEYGGNRPRCDWDRWTRVEIYQTAAGRIIVNIERLSRWQGEHNRYDVTIHETIESAVEALRDGTDGMPSASCEALEEAAESNAAWIAYASERVA